MYRVVPVILVVAAVCMHFGYCEWYYGEDTRNVTSEQFDRAIYYRHRSTTVHARGDYLPRNLILLAKSSVATEDAKLYGVLVPALLAGVAGVAFYFGTRADGTQGA